jgi:hypothetical protein
MVVVIASRKVRNAIFIRLKVPPQSTKNLRRRCSLLNNTVLAKPYKLGFLI